MLEKSTLFTIGDAQVRTDKVLVFVAAIVLMIGLDQFVRRSRLGRGIRATAQDAETAQLMGVNIDRVVVLTFLLGGLLAGAAGFLFTIFFETARFNIGFLPGIKAFTAAVLGGIGNIRGALSAASCSACSRTTAPPSSGASGRTSSPSSCSSSCCCSGRAACSARRLGRARA